MERGSSVPAVLTEGVGKQYSAVDAVREVDLRVESGEVFGLIGPNGAGKSTMISMLCAMTDPTSGTARVAGRDVVSERDEVRRSIGVVFQESTIDPHLTAVQNLRFHADLYGVPHKVTELRVERVLDMVGLWERRRERVRTYSGGMKRRLEIARGMLHAPHVFFVDEPSTGLDPEARQAVWQCLHELREMDEMTIFMTTHYLEEAEHCDRVAVMDRGSIVVVDTPEALKASVGQDRVCIGTPDPEAIVRLLLDAFGILGTVEGHSVVFTVAGGAEFIPKILGEMTVPTESVRVSRPTLDDVFMHYTGSSLRETERRIGSVSR